MISNNFRFWDKSIQLQDVSQNETRIVKDGKE